MLWLQQVLENLDPPLKHKVEYRHQEVQLTLIDPTVPARVSRSLHTRQYHNELLLQLILLHAVNEIRGKGSHVPLRALR